MQTISPLNIRAEDIRLSRKTFQPETAVYPFHVDIYEGPLLCEGHRGNLFKNYRPVHGSGDDLVGRRRSSNPLAFFAPKHKLDFALSLHTPHPNNYYHFLAHTLTKVLLAEETLQNHDFPILVGEDMTRMAFYQDAVQMGFFGDHPLIIQGRQDSFLLKKIVVAKPAHQPEPYLDPVLDRLNVKSNPASQRRVFIQRGPRSANSRGILNMDEVAHVLGNFGFELIDPQDFSFRQQMDIFSGARYVASPHGAGLTNIAFRRDAALDVYEIKYLNGHNSCYDRMCQYYGYEYASDFMSETSGKWTSGSAVIDCSKLEVWLKGTI